MDHGQCPEYHSKLLLYTIVINLHTWMKVTGFCLVPCGKNQCSGDTDLESFVRFPSLRCKHLNTTLIIRQNIQSSTRVPYKIHGIMEIQTYVTHALQFKSALDLLEIIYHSSL
jgi:hypothetical protein